MRPVLRTLVALLALSAIAACSETDRITATPTPRVTGSVAVAPTTAAPTVTAAATATATAAPTTARPSSTPTAAATSASTTPAASARPSASGAPTLPPGTTLPAMPDQPTLPTGTTVVAKGTVVFAIASGETRKFEPADLAAAGGATAPPSAALAWTLAWRATEPLSAAWYRQTDLIDLGRGRWGTAGLGGAGFQLRNDGSATVVGELSYTIATR